MSESSRVRDHFRYIIYDKKQVLSKLLRGQNDFEIQQFYIFANAKKNEIGMIFTTEIMTKNRSIQNFLDTKIILR